MQNGLVYYYDPAQGTVFPEKSQQLTSADTSWNDQGEGGGVYVVTGEVTISDTIYLAGDVVLVLEDGCKLTCAGGIVVGGANLTITAPTKDGTGELHVTTRDNDAIAAIGGGNVYNGYRDEQFTGSITINGGVISADASNAGGAGIGGANNWGLCKTYTPGIVTINNGSVCAKGGEGAAGIGGGAKEGGDGTGDIHGIKVRINGGTVEAHGGGNGAGIGGGYEGTVDEIAVQGGEKITAQGGDNGAGIGSGYSGYFNKISIEESTDVTAKGGVGGAGIGSGMIPNWNVKPKYRGEITLKNSKIQASGKAGGAGIGSGMQNSVDTITIDGGTIIAFGGTGGAGIGGGSQGKVKRVDIKSGKIFAHGGVNDQEEVDTAPVSGGVDDQGEVDTAPVSGAGIGNGGMADQIDGDPENQGATRIEIEGGEVTAQGGKMAAGIGSGTVGNALPGTVIISGGDVNASGGAANRWNPDIPSGAGGAGIGGGNNQDGWTTTISGGKVTATGSDSAAGIGGGNEADAGTILISGKADVTAAGGAYGAGIGTGAYKGIGNGSVKITGSPKISAVGGIYAAGIGGGSTSACEKITISGDPRIIAKGTAGETKTNGQPSAGSGAGIGTGAFCSHGSQQVTIEITGGKIDADAGEGGAGIGGGIHSYADRIKVSGGQIQATGGDYGAGIGNGRWTDNGENQADRIEISGGRIRARGGKYSAGIGGGSIAHVSKITISGGDVRADGGEGGAGIGSGIFRDWGSIEISGGTVQAYAGSGADAIGAGEYPSNKWTSSFSTGADGQAVIVANTVTDHSMVKDWRGIYFRGTEAQGYRGVILNHQPLSITKEEYIPKGFTLDVLSDSYKNPLDSEKAYADDRLTAGSPEKLANYGTIYVYGDYGNLDEHNLTCKDQGKVVYLVKDMKIVQPPEKLRYHVGETLDLTGMKVRATYQEPSKARDLNTGEYAANPSQGTVLQAVDDEQEIMVTWQVEETTPFDQNDDPVTTAPQRIGEKSAAAALETSDESTDGTVTRRFTDRTGPLQMYYLITYNPNGGVFADGSGASKMEENDVTDSDGTGSTASVSLQAVRDGYDFLGWQLTGSTEERFEVGDKFVPMSDVTFTALWEKIPEKPDHGGGTDSGGSSGGNDRTVTRVVKTSPDEPTAGNDEQDVQDIIRASAGQMGSENANGIGNIPNGGAVRQAEVRKNSAVRTGDDTPIFRYALLSVVSAGICAGFLFLQKYKKLNRR